MAALHLRGQGGVHKDISEARMWAVLARRMWDVEENTFAGQIQTRSGKRTCAVLEARADA